MHRGTVAPAPAQLHPYLKRFQILLPWACQEQELDPFLRHLPPKDGCLDFTKTPVKLQNGAYKGLGGWAILFSLGVGGRVGGKWWNVICPFKSTQKV